MIMERIFQTELTIQENNCEEKSVYRFQGETCIVHESKPLQNIRMSSGSLQEDIMLKEETVDDPTEEYEDVNMKSCEALKDVTIADNVQGEKRKKKEKTYPCEKCQLISQSSANFKKHMMTHSGEKPYKCVICQKAFRQRHHLTDHRRTHTGERPFECDECGSKFVQKSSLNLHKKKHSGIKPYSCNMCNHSTYEKMHMIMHMRTHTGEKPYQCEKCGHMFSNATRLKFHRMIHTGERRFKCDECGVNFREKVTLQKHKGVHINVGPFECEECGQEFSRLAGLSLHRKVHTKKHDYMYVFNKTAHETLKSTPPAEVATSKKTDIESSGIASNSDKTKNAPDDICNTQHNPNVVQFTGSPAVSCEEQVHIRRITSSMPGTAKSDNNVYTSSTFDSNEPKRNNVVPSRVEAFSQNKVKENLASSLSENVQNLDSVVHPDHVRAALESGTVLETQDEHGKGFFIVLPPSLKNKDITFISDSSHPNGSISLPLQVTDHTMDLPGNETVVENSPEIFSEKDNNGNNEAYQSVVQEIHEVDVCDYSVEVPNDDVNCSPREARELHDNDDDLHHYQDETHICPEDVQGELTDDDQRYSQVVREEIHADGGSLLIWNDGLEHLTEVTYVIEEGNEDPIMIHPQEAKSHSVETLREVDIKPKKRKSKGSEFPDDDHINPRRQKRHKSDCERPISVRIKVKDKKLKEKRVKTRKVYDCQQCGKVCKTSSNYISHMRTHSGERPYFCGFCGMGFKQIAHLRSHIRIHTGERPYVCTICNAAFTQSSRLNSHRKTKHAEGRNVVIKKDKPVIEHKVRNFYCKVCKKTFINECFKIDHMRTHISLEPYECKICGIRYKSKSSMIKHNLKHSDHKCICEICGAGFLDLSSLQNHRITQHEMSLTESGMSDMCINVKIGEEKDFVVINPSIKDIQKVVVDSDKVNEEFINVTETNDCQVKQEVIHVTETDGYVKSEVMPAADLDDTHVKNEKMEVTETEGYSMEVGASPCSDNVSSIKVKNEIEQSTDFNDTSHRNSDICLGSGTEFQLSDTAEPIKDEFSEKNYATYVDSIGRKIWVCKVCDKPFLQSSNLHSHMRMHTGERPYKCNICPQAFRQITHLKDHMSRHTGMKPYKCGECGSCFSQRSAVTRHIKNLHNENAKVIKNTEYIMNGGRNMPHLDFENEPSGSKQPLQVEKIVSRRPRKRKPKENVNQNSSAKMKTCDKSDKPYMKPHQLCHTGERPYKCSLCEETFMQKAHLHSHEFHHTGEKSYVCKKCGASFIQSFMLNTHMRKCMEDKEGITTFSVKKHLCVCGTSFRLIRQLVIHQKSCMVMEDSDDKSIDMTELDAQLDEESEDECQLRRKKKNEAHKKGESKRNRTPETTEFRPACSVKIFTCKVCNVTLKNFAEYKTHLQQHGGGTQQVCEDCGAPFRRASALRFHQRVKHDRIDDRYKDYTSNFVGQEDIKEEISDGSGDDDNAQVQPNYTNVESDYFSENIGKKIEENVEKSNGRQTKEDVKVNNTHKIAKLKSNTSPTKGNAVKRSITHTKEYAGRVSNKPVRGSTRLKNRKNKRSVIVSGSIKTSKASSIKVDKQVNKSRKVPDGEYDTQYACEACGKVFTRSSKLKHHVAMWCKGLQDHSEVDTSKDIEVQQQPSQLVKRTKRKCSKFSRKDKNDSSVHFSSKETTKNFRSSDINSYQSEYLTVKDDIISKDSESKVLSTLDMIKSEEQEARQRIVEDKNLSSSQYCKDCDIHSCKVHLQTYVSKQPFRCNQCSLTFSQKAHLTNHSRKHKSEKPYKCRAFSKGFTRASRPKDHIRLHGKDICTFEI